MKRFIFAFFATLVALSFVGCNKSEEQKKLDKANDLLDSKGLQLISKLDSVEDYPEAYITLILSYKYISKIDSIHYMLKGKKLSGQKAKDVYDMIVDLQILQETYKRIHVKHMEKDDYASLQAVGYRAKVDKDERGFPIYYFFNEDLSSVTAVKMWKKEGK